MPQAGRLRQHLPRVFEMNLGRFSYLLEAVLQVQQQETCLSFLKQLFLNKDTFYLLVAVA